MGYSGGNVIKLPEQLAGTSWPTEQWRRQAPGPDVDVERLERAMARVFAAPTLEATGETHATVVIHRGRLIAERYAEGKGPEDTVRYTDRQVGKVLKAVDDLGLRDSTIIVLWGDHGWHLGDSAIWGKHSPFERAMKSPLVVRAPGIPPARSAALVETIDIYPTLVEMCAPAFTMTEHPLDGRSLVPILAGKKSQVRNAALSYWRDAVSVRSETHRLNFQTRKTRQEKCGSGDRTLSDL